MSEWLDPLRAALADAPAPVPFFFRDDDAGWRDDRLARLLDVFAAVGAPIDLAAIPAAVSPRLARELRARQAAAPELVRIHQHGYTHENHEAVGRKCEFGPSRPFAVQLADVALGRDRLRAMLDVELDPIFTPPWNRCTADTPRALQAVGLRALSRESRAAPVATDGLVAVDVTVDWERKRRGVALTPAELGQSLADAVTASGPVGVMLHHAVMDGAGRERVAELLALVTSSHEVRLVTMSGLVSERVAS